MIRVNWPCVLDHTSRVRTSLAHSTSMVDDDATPKVGGSRAQRRNRNKRSRDQVEDTATAVITQPTKPSMQQAMEVPPDVHGVTEQPPRKKTKKEKRRELKAAAATTTVEPAAPADQQRQIAIEESRRVFVGHLPQSATEEAIRSRFADCGDLASVEMQRRHGPSQRFKGSAFLTFTKRSAAARALKLNLASWQADSSSEKKMVVALAQAAAPRGDVSKDAGKVVADKGGDAAQTASCYVGNLPADANEKAVRAAFRDVCGESTIRKVHLLPAVGGARRAFIDFGGQTAAVAAATAVGRNGTSMLGRVLEVAFSRRASAPSGDGRRSAEAKARRRERRAQKREQTSESAEKPVLVLGS